MKLTASINIAEILLKGVKIAMTNLKFQKFKYFGLKLQM
jgi:uncharacterized phage-associated protein